MAALQFGFGSKITTRPNSCAIKTKKNKERETQRDSNECESETNGTSLAVRRKTKRTKKKMVTVEETHTIISE